MSELTPISPASGDPTNRDQLRHEAYVRMRFEGGWNWPTDLLLAFAPPEVDIEATSEILLQTFAEPSETGKPPRPVDDAARRATLILLRCYCKDSEDTSLSLSDGPFGPSEADINRARVNGTDPFPDGSWYSPSTNFLFSELCRCCRRLEWRTPLLPEVTEIRTSQEAIEFVRAVEGWIQEKENELLTTTADSEFTGPRGGPAPPIVETVQTLESGRRVPRRGVTHRRNSEELFKAAMRKHHGYDNGSVLNSEPISTRGIETLTNGAVSDTTAGRLLRKHFGTVENYQTACLSGAIGSKLIVLLGDALHAFGTFDPTENDTEDDNDTDGE